MRTRKIQLTMLSVCFAVLLSVSITGAVGMGQDVSAATTDESAASKSQTPDDQNDNFVGKETCLACHTDHDKTLEKTLHGQSADARTPAARADRMCETCHGPGKNHAESADKKDIKSFKTLPANAVNDTCLDCHANKNTHIQWSGGKHDARKVSCVSCHSV